MGSREEEEDGESFGEDVGGDAASDAEEGNNNHQPEQANTMRASLQALQTEDPTCVFIARRINKLGFESPTTLKTYFSKNYGEVKSVHVSHSMVKGNRSGDPVEDGVHWRKRPAALGFVVMMDAETTQKILSDGPELTVEGVQVVVQAFQRHSEHTAEGGSKNNSQAQEPASGGGGGGRVKEASPLCFVCGSTICAHLGVVWCQVCKRGYVQPGYHATTQPEPEPPSKRQRR
mmetsp:Transcript_45907/g.109336  ORF Transcript_45907/g.109336 Transcript_45907/m.109336 type:complete len:232 (-) Transcript_45907:20-715(-)